MTTYKLRDYIHSAQHELFSTKGVLFSFSLIKDGYFHTHLPCWGPVSDIIAGYEDSCDTDLFEPSIGIERKGPIPLKDYDMIAMVKHSRVTMHSLLHTYMGGRFKRIAELCIKALEARVGSTEEELASEIRKGSISRYGQEAATYYLLRDLKNIPGVLFIPEEVLREVSKVELMALLMFFREHARIHPSGITSDRDRSRTFADSVIENLQLGPETSYGFDLLYKSYRTGSGHLGWNNSLSISDQFQLLFPETMHIPEKTVFEWKTADEAIEESQANGDYYLDECLGTVFDGGWSDSNNVVMNFLTPRNKSQLGDLMGNVPGYKEFRTQLRSETTLTYLKEILSGSELGEIIRFDSHSIIKLQETLKKCAA